MSHQTGIHANDDLKIFFSKCKDGSVRVFKVDIKNEELVLEKYYPPQGSWEDDFDTYVSSLIENSQPCYLFYRLDTENDSGFEWLFICWSPDSAVVRQKMLFASTKATLKKEFGGGQIKHELFGSQKEELSLRSYKRNKGSSNQPLPFSDSEEILLQIKKNEAILDTSVDQKQAMQGIAFPISEDAIRALSDMKDQLLNYVQLSIDTENEEINLESKMDTDVHSLPSRVPSDHARYHLFRFPHSYEGDFIKSIVFIYTVPGYNCPVKERMLYSSCKAPLLNVIESKMGIEIAKKIESDDPEELTEAFLIDEIHPKQNICKQKFPKPKGPHNRGARRLLKSSDMTD